MRSVRFSTNEVTPPGKCACCLAPSTEEIEIVKQTAANLVTAIALKSAGGSSIAARGIQQRACTPVPYCESCANHVRWTTTRGWFGVAMLLLRDVAMGGLVALMLLEMLPKSIGSNGWVQLIVAVLFALGLLLMTYIRILSRPTGPLDRRHAKSGHSIDITSWSSSSIELKCHNDEFAQVLQAANPGAALLPPSGQVIARPVR